MNCSQIKVYASHRPPSGCSPCLRRALHRCHWAFAWPLASPRRDCSVAWACCWRLFHTLSCCSCFVALLPGRGAALHAVRYLVLAVPWLVWCGCLFLLSRLLGPLWLSCDLWHIVGPFCAVAVVLACSCWFHALSLPYDPSSNTLSSCMCFHLVCACMLSFCNSRLSNHPRSAHTKNTEPFTFPGQAIVLLLVPSTQSRPPYSSPSTRTAAAWAAARPLI